MAMHIAREVVPQLATAPFSSRGDLVDNSRLKRKLAEMKHRMCLFEFGLGTIAILLRSRHEVVDVGKVKDKITLSSSQNDSQRTLESIIRVLQDVENSIKTASEKLDGFATIRNDNPSHNTIHVKEAILLPKVNEMEEMCGEKVKTKIFIDETHSGQNTLTSICDVRVVENIGFGDENRTDVSSNSINSRSRPIYFLDPSLAALSTLATVATEQAIENGKSVNTQQLIQGQTARRESSHVNAVNYSEGANNVPFKKRRVPSQSARSGRGRRGRKQRRFPL